MVEDRLIDHAPSYLGATTGTVLAMKALDFPLIVIFSVVTVSVMFGLMVHRDIDKPTTLRRKLLNAGAIWIIAFAVGIKFADNIITVALIALGVGIAGEKVLNALEVGIMALMDRLIGAGRKG